MKLDVQLRYLNPWILLDVLFGRASLRWAMRSRKILSAAEIGVQQGINANTILRRAKPQRMVAADPWDRYQDELGLDGDAIEMIARRRLKRWGQVEFVKSGDRGVISSSLGREIDYLYIDAAHDYDNVLADITAYWPCVATGGVLAGHDICWPSVFKAVADFASAHNLEVQASGTDWWIVNARAKWDASRLWQNNKGINQCAQKTKSTL